MLVGGGGVLVGGGVSVGKGVWVMVAVGGAVVAVRVGVGVGCGVSVGVGVKVGRAVREGRGVGLGSTSASDGMPHASNANMAKAVPTTIVNCLCKFLPLFTQPYAPIRKNLAKAALFKATLFTEPSQGWVIRIDSNERMMTVNYRHTGK